MKKLILHNKQWISTLSIFMFFLLGNSNIINAQICNADFVVTDQNILISNLENRRAIIKVYDENLVPVFECSSLMDPCQDPLLVELNDCGTYFVQIQTFTHWRIQFCNIFEEVIITGCGASVVDCPTLNANIGDSCDDNNSLTLNDEVQADCSCAGTIAPPVFDCQMISANIGDSCDDGNPNTSNDEVQADCSCVGTIAPPVFDCSMISANIGDSCDDGNPNTSDDEVQADCSCAGTVPPPVFDCPMISANIGDNCDDGNAVTTDDTVQADCSCAGTIAPPTFDCPILSANVGDFCDDGDASTNNDIVQADCSCSGTAGPPPTFDCPTLMANIGETCDDGNPNTINDIAQADCSCAGTLFTEFNLAHWTFENCNSDFDYDEFTANTNVPFGFSSVTASTFSSVGAHSCNPGPDLNTGTLNVAICKDIRPFCFFVENSSDAYTFSVTVTPDPGQAVYISKLSFFENAPDTFEYLTGQTGPNNPPTEYGWRILRDGQEIARQIDIPTSEGWSFEEFDFSDLGIVASNCTQTTFTFELLGYCEKDNGADVSIWDVDEVQIFGFAATAQPLMITTPASDMAVECNGSGNMIEYENWLAANGGAQVNDPYSGITFSNNGATAFQTVCAGDGFANVTFTATDNCGRSVDTEATFAVFDTQAPAFGFIPSDVTIECDDPLPTQTVIAADICSTVEIELAEWTKPGDCPNASIFRRVWTVTDECGNEAQATQIVTIEDNTPPVFETVPDNVTISCDMAVPTAIPTFSDNCADINDITFEAEAVVVDGFCTGQQTITNTWTITDPCGNTATTTQTITVVDSDAPTLIGVPAPISQDCAIAVPAPPTVTATDNCDANPQVTFNEFSIPTNCGGTFVRTWSTSDACGNSFSQSQEITLIDNTAPNITTLAQDGSSECAAFGNDQSLIAWLNSNGGAVAMDDCSNFSWSNDFTGLNNVCGNTGTTTVTFTATDACGNAAATTATFTIEDTTPPTIMQQANNPLTVQCDGTGNINSLNAWLGANGNALATDLCGSITWTNDYTSSSFVAGCGNTGSATVVFTASDQCGNTAQTTGMFVIEDTQNPFITGFPMDLVIQCEDVGTAATTAAVNAWLANAAGATAGDFCNPNNLIWTNDFTAVPMACSNNPITFTADDGCGNTATVQAQIIVQDNNPPVFTTLPVDGSSMCEPFPVGATNASNDFFNWLNTNNATVAANDCSGVSSIFSDFTSFAINCNNNPSGLGTITWTAFDVCGLSSTASATFTVTPAPTPTPVPISVISSGHNVSTLSQKNGINHFVATLNKRVVDLFWTNNTGPLNDNFVIERSIDGVTFEAIGEYDNLGIDDSAISYKQEDDSPNIGENFYRLRTNYLDGTHFYSDIRKIHISDIEDFGLFPNPAQEEVNISLKGYRDRDITIQMVDHLGHVLLEKSVDGILSENHKISLKNYQNGFYTIWVFAENRRPIGKKLIISRLY